jgi:drug/metabolite transporter (DMT)-like permease
MPITAIVLVTAAAAMHAAWNLIVKKVAEKQIVTWWALVLGSVLNLPLLIGARVPGRIWPYAIASSIVEVAYFGLLIRAYQFGDFSEVYPLARGAAPVFLAVWATLFLGERPRAAGLVGLGLLLSGLVIVAGSRLFGRLLGHRLEFAVNRAEPVEGEHSGQKTASVKVTPLLLVTTLGVALCISVYSAIDAGAVRQMSPPAYNVLVFGLTGLFVAPIMVKRYSVRSILGEGRSQIWRIAAVGVLMLMAYLLVLEAYSMARASYVGALREVSVVIAAIGGWHLLKERFGRLRIAGALLIFSGIVVIAIAK